MTSDAINRLLSRNVEKVIDRAHLERRLLAGEKLRVKLGIDPTAPELHLGNAVVLRKLGEFQELGHKIVLIIGDFTAQIGDPSGRAEARRPLSESAIKKNMKDYLRQAGKVIDVKKADVFWNSEWFKKGGAEKIVELAGAASIQQVLRRADFKKRLGSGGDVSLLEAFYPVFQGYDSVAVRADLEVGGADQEFNLLMGRRIQRHFGQPEQDILTVPLLLGTDGVKKMSKSAGNYIGLEEAPGEMFGKIMSIPDVLVGSYFLLCTGLSVDEIQGLEKSLKPRDFKARLGYEVVRLYRGESAAREARENFGRMFGGAKPPVDLPELRLPRKKISALDLVVASGAVKSKSEARRLIEQGGFEISGSAKKNPNEILNLRGGEAARIGKKTFLRLKI